MSDDDNRRGPRGPRKPGGPGGSRGGGFGARPGGGTRGGFGGGRDGGRDGDRPARDGAKGRGFKDSGPRDSGSRDFGSPDSGSRGAGFKASGFRPAAGAGGFRDAPPAGERPRRFEVKERPRSSGDNERPRRFGDGERPRRSGDSDKPFKPRRFEGDERAPRGQDRPERGPRRDGAPGGFGQGEGRSFKPRFPRDGDSRPERGAADRPRSSSRPERPPSLPRAGNPERLASPEKEGGVERIAKVIARAGAASRREAEEMIEQGRVTVDGERIASPALDVAPTARITIDGEPLPARERTRLWLYHKPSGLVATNHDPEGRTTLFEALPEDLPRVITIGRLDINTEGLLLLTNDGGLARVLGHPETGWLRRYRVRAYGEITQDKLDAVRGGVTIDGENFGPVIATRDRQVGDNTWLTVDLREGKNREVKRVLEHLGLVVNRLIRISFGPFQLGDLAEGEVEEVRTRVLRDQLGDQLAGIAGVDFDAPMRSENRLDRPHTHEDERKGRSAPPVAGRGGRAPAPGGAGRPGRFDERGPRRFERDAPADEKPARARREGAYHRAREESGDAPRDILLRAEEGRGAIWRDEETSGLKPKRTGPRRGADPREERSERAARDEAGGRERVRAKPIEDPKGRRVTVERVTGASPDLPRRPRYTRADFAAPSGEERPFRRPRDDGDSADRRPARAPRREMDERPPRRDGDDRPARSGYGARPARGEGDRPFKPRFDRGEGAGRSDGEGFKPRGPRKDFGDRPPRKEFGERGPRKDFSERGPRKEFSERGPRREFSERPPRSEGERSFRPRPEGGPRKDYGDRPPRGPSEGGRGRDGGGQGGKPFGKGGPSRGGPSGGPSRGGPARSGAARSPDRGGGARPKGPRKPRS